MKNNHFNSFHNMFNSSTIAIEISTVSLEDAVFPEKPNWFNYIEVSMKPYDMERTMSFCELLDDCEDTICILTRKNGHRVVSNNTRDFLLYCLEQIHLIYRKFRNEAEKENLRIFRQLRLVFTQSRPELTPMQCSIIEHMVKREASEQRKLNLRVKMGVYHSAYVPKFETARSFEEKHNLKKLRELSKDLQELLQQNPEHEEEMEFCDLDKEMLCNLDSKEFQEAAEKACEESLIEKGKI